MDDKALLSSSSKPTHQITKMIQKAIRIPGTKSARTRNCSSCKPRSCDDEASISHQELLYDRATWRMYNRIMQARKASYRHQQQQQKHEEQKNQRQSSPSSRDNESDDKPSVHGSNDTAETTDTISTRNDVVPSLSSHQHVDTTTGEEEIAKVSFRLADSVQNNNEEATFTDDSDEVPFAIDMAID
uniref:Uncharacterized protein n=1 Tax=Helicotheca tamesis TaxID=374047 RepID=A0A6U0HFQ9_9STRA|mmetsp:Transcript_6557/g.8861  ORF Transcript_6557/g.8861 Transcript_6557/m.8861 type:complete len:186 (+) Transcript_6557:46-603(+)